MAALTTITYQTPTGRPGSLSANGQVVSARGVFPSGQTTATCPIGDLSANDYVEVRALTATTGNTIPIIEILASRTTGGAGVVTVGTQDGSAQTADVTLQIIKWKL